MYVCVCVCVCVCIHTLIHTHTLGAYINPKSVYDADKHRYDHHQREFTETFVSTYALIWDI